MAGKRKAKFQVLLAAVDKVSAPIRKMNRSIEKLTRPIQKLKRQMSSLAREAGFKKLGGAIAGVGKQFAKLALVGAVAVAGLFRALDRTSKTMDTLAKTTRALNFPVEEFQKWKQVSQLAGVGAENFDKSIQKLSKNIGELRLNTGTMSTILDKADPAFKKQLVNAKNNAEAFDLVIDKMRSLTSAQDRAALANAAFGRGGKELINVANLSAKEIAKLKEQVSGRGGIISSEALANAETFQDSLLLVKTAIGNIWSEIAGNLFPVVSKMMDGVREWATANKELIQVKVTDFIRGAIDAGKKMIEVFREWGPKVWNIVKSLGGLKFILGLVGAITLAPLVLAILGVGAALIPVIASVGTLGLAFLVALGPVGLLVLGIAAVVTALVLNFDKIKNFFLSTKIGGAVGKLFSGEGGIASLKASNEAQGIGVGVGGNGSLKASNEAQGIVGVGGIASLKAMLEAQNIGVAGAETPAPAGPGGPIELVMRVDQAGTVTGIEPETDSELTIASEGLAGEAF
jgi:uncharacterized protein YoxC